MPLTDVSELAPHCCDETTRSLIDEGKPMPADCKLSGRDTLSLLSRVEHCFSAAFLVYFGAHHVTVGISPRFPSSSYEFLEPLQKFGQNVVLVPQRRIIKPGVWLTVGSRILYFFFKF